MGVYTRARLEGRALEHAISQDPGYDIRMGSDSGQFECVRGGEVKAIRTFMNERVEAFLAQLSACGLHRTGGESLVVLPDGVKKSVDFRCWFAPRAETCLIELKWSRQSLSMQ